jgi:hypothetical protein
MAIDGEQFVDILTGMGLKLSPATKTQWKAKNELSVTILRNALNQFQNQILSNAIQPIVEFHELNLDHEKNVDSFLNRIDSAKIVDKMKASSGIYAFFDASGRVAYVGKTEKNNLFNEMENRYWNKTVSFRALKKGKSSSFSVRLADTAVYFSAYEVSAHLIKNVEALLTRVIINNASNIRLESFSGQSS